MEQNLTNKPYDIIKIDKYTNKIQMPNLLLMTRSFDVIGKISKYTNWNISLVGNGIDEISFEVNKYVNGELCPIWNDLIDLKIIDVRGFGRFEISVDYADNTQTVKSVHGISLETELAQIPLYEFHVNDDEAMTMKITEHNNSDFDENGNFIPTVFYNPNDEKHSLLHRVLADKAPHWSIGYVTPCIALDEESQPENVETFQRTYTVDGTTIYDFLTGDVATESNVIFVFDTINRKINCYSLCDCIDQETGEISAKGIGKDTTILVSKNKLANEITISSNKDNIKNCFRIEGGDDIITDMVRVVNINGSNYIYQFSDFQYNDMPEELVKRIKKYNEELAEQEAIYYGEDGIYTRLYQKYDDLLYYESSMMPEVVISETTAEEQYTIMVEELENMTVGVSSVNNYNNNLFVGVTNNVEAMANILIDTRYTATIIEGSTSYDSQTKTWTGNIQITRATDDTDYYPKNNTEAYQNKIAVNISDDELTFTKQKIEKALSKGSMLDIDFDIAEMNDDEIREYFNLYSLNRLKSFYDGYNSCLSVLMALPSDSSVRQEMYDKYFKRMTIISNPPTSKNPNPVPGVLEIRQKQVDIINADIEMITKEQAAFQNKWDFQKYLGDDLYKIFCSYRREDSYTNNNYISDGLSTSECLAKAKELVEAATKEAKKACVLQRTVSTSLNNLFALPEFEQLYDKFALFNYIRIRTEDEILKLRLIGVEFNGDSVSDIHVTFSEQIESVDGKMSDLQSIIQQASSMATSFPSTAFQAKKGAEAQSTVSGMFSNGLNAANTMLTNNDNNEVTITPSGIICKRMDDEGYYGDKQLRLTGNMLAFTKDAWKNVALAIGETTFENPITKKNETSYGIIAENIVGKLIASENMYIGNKDGSVQITSDGITISNGVIKSKNYSEEDNTGSIINLTDGSFSFAGDKLTYNETDGLSIEGKVVASSGKIGNFNIDKALYSGTNSNESTIAGVYLGTDGIRQYQDANNYVDIKKGTLTAKGANISGEITATTGTIGCWTIDSNSIYRTSSEFGNASGMYFGTSGLSVKNNFIVNSAGKLTAKGADIIGTIKAKYIYANRCYYLCNSDNDEFASPIKIISDTDDGDSNTTQVNFGRLGSNPNYITFIDDTGISESGDSRKCRLKTSSFEVEGMTIFKKNINCEGNITTQNLYAQKIRSANDYYITKDSENNITILGYNPNTDYDYVGNNTIEGLVLRGKSIKLNNTGGATVSSDERLKNSFKQLDEFDDVFMNLSPCAFKYNNGTSGRFHFGFKAQDVKTALEENGYTTQDFGGFVQMTDNSDNDDYCGVDDPMGLIYTEFTAWNTHMIQKLCKKVEKLEQEIEDLKAKI